MSTQGWLPIETAPREAEILVGRWVNGSWRMCQSGFYYFQGDRDDSEEPYWDWHCDWDLGGVTDGDGPTHWLDTAPPPSSPTPEPTNG